MEDQHVAVARPPQLRRGGAVERPLEHDMEQGVDRDGVELAEVDAGRPLLAPPLGHRFGRRLAAVDRRHTEHPAVGEQVVDHDERRSVDAVGVVEQQHGWSGGAARRRQRLERGVEQPRPSDGSAAVAFVPVRQRLRREQVGDSRQGHDTGGPVRRGPEHVAPGGIGDSEALVAESGLADPRRSVDAERLTARIVQRAAANTSNSTRRPTSGQRVATGIARQVYAHPLSGSRCGASRTRPALAAAASSKSTRSG